MMAIILKKREKIYDEMYKTDVNFFLSHFLLNEIIVLLKKKLRVRILLPSSDLMQQHIDEQQLKLNI